MLADARRAGKGILTLGSAVVVGPGLERPVMKLTREDLDGGIRCLVLEGRLDIGGCAGIDLVFSGHAASEKALVLVDLGGVEFVASLGLRTLLMAARVQRQRGGRMVLCGARPAVAKILEMAGLASVLPVVADRDAGVAALASIP